MGGASRLIAFFDECGDHSLTKIDNDFPLFLLAAIVVKRTDYVQHIIPAMGSLKLSFWNHEGINLHSREIRKSKGPFSFMMVPDRRTAFIEHLNTMMAEMPFTLFVAGIKKDQHLNRYGKAATNPYDLALEFALERIVHLLDQEGETELPCVVESRGKNEDEQLERVFYRVMSSGTYYRPGEQFRKLKCPLVFRSKQDNIAGLQLADLCAHPCARHALRPTQPNRAYDIARQHLYSKGAVNGWKIFP